jgi:hypothetical protein
VLSVAAARAPAEGDITMFNEHAVGAIAVERSLHELLRPLRPERGGRDAHADGARISPTRARAILALTDRFGPEPSPAERASAGRHFATTSRYEWMVWDMGYRREGWPI